MASSAKIAWISTSSISKQKKWEGTVGRPEIQKFGALPAGGPALSRGDLVLKINGRPAREVLAETEALVFGATPQWIRLRALQEMARGVPGAEVNLDIEPVGQPGQVVSVSLRYAAAAPPPERRPEKIS